MKALVATIASITFMTVSISQASAQGGGSISVGSPRVTPITPVKVGNIFKYGAKFFV
jgi:hypothetical protein